MQNLECSLWDHFSLQCQAQQWYHQPSGMNTWFQPARSRKISSAILFTVKERSSIHLTIASRRPTWTEITYILLQLMQPLSTRWALCTEMVCKTNQVYIFYKHSSYWYSKSLKCLPQTNPNMHINTTNTTKSQNPKIHIWNHSPTKYRQWQPSSSTVMFPQWRSIPAQAQTHTSQYGGRGGSGTEMCYLYFHTSWRGRGGGGSNVLLVFHKHYQQQNSLRALLVLHWSPFAATLSVNKSSESGTPLWMAHNQLNRHTA